MKDVTTFLVVAAFLLAGCAGHGGATIDGWPVGGSASCSVALGRGNAGVDADWCQHFLAKAQAALDVRDAAHAPVKSSALYKYGKLQERTVPIYVAVFDLADGSARAIGVGASLGLEPITADFGP